MEQFNRKTKTSHTTTSQAAIISVAILSSCTILSGMILSSSTTHADTVTSNATVNVNASCTITTGGDDITDTIDPGTYEEYTGTGINVSCNDPGGYALYAIGFSGDSDDAPDNNRMLGLNSTYIPTGNSGDGSYWAMKVAGSSTTSTVPTIDNSYSTYQIIPATYTMVSHYGSSTTGTTTNSVTTPTYKVQIASDQPVGTYTGKVKYTMVHPNDAPAPRPQPAPPTSCNTPVPNVTYMQDITPSTKASVLASLTEDAPYYIRDNRDEEPYCVSKLKDGNLWMIDNLRLDLTDSTILNGLTTSNTHVNSASLTSLKSGNRSAGAQYASSGFEIWDSSHTSNPFNQAKANADYKDTTTTSYGAGSGKTGVYYNYCAASAGSHCYDVDVGTGNASYDLCPAGWRMPTGGSSGEYQALYTAYSSDQATFKNALSTPLSGYFYSDEPEYRYVRGYFLSSTYGGYANGMKLLYVISTRVDPSDSDFRHYGSSVRCLLGS